MENLLLTLTSFFHIYAVSQILWILLMMASGMILRKILIKIFTKIFRIIDRKTETELFDLYLKPALKPVGNFAFILALYILNTILELPAEFGKTYQSYFYRVLDIFLILNIAWFFYAMVNLLSLYLENKAAKTESKLDDQLVPIVRKFLRVLVFILAVLFIFQNLGYSISGILAGLGIGGFALAFASKDALSNIFGSIIIFTDRPFQVGDWILTSGIEGIVEEVGLRSTKIRTFEKTLVTVPNNTISNAVIENLSARKQRRISYSLGIKYSTSSKLIKKAVEEIREILKNHPHVDQSYWLVNFTEFGNSSLNLFLYFFADTAVWADYLNIRQEINLLIMEKLEELGIEIAFPSTSLYVEKFPSFKSEATKKEV